MLTRCAVLQRGKHLKIPIHLLTITYIYLIITIILDICSDYLQ